MDTMVTVIPSTNSTSPARSPKAKSKQFTLIICSLGVIMLVWLYSSNPNRDNSSSDAITASRGGTRASKLTPGTVTAAVVAGTTNDLQQSSRSTSSTEYPDWTTQNKEDNTKKIRQISLIGERNSGTRWSWQLSCCVVLCCVFCGVSFQRTIVILTLCRTVCPYYSLRYYNRHLNDCFNHSIPVERHLTRYKHWFQYPNYTAYPHDTLVIAQFRNPYDWLKAMQRVPHHSPSHLKKEWKEFITTPWTTPRVGADIEIGKTITAANNSTDTTPCQQNFIYQDIVSCVMRPLPKESYDHKLRFSEDTPIYEHRIDHSGLPYNNIMEMRAAKIENFLDVQNYPGIAAVWAVQYEYLLQRGTEHLIQRVAEWTGIEPQCDAYPPQLRRERPFEPEFVEYVTKHLNWTAEKLIGYGKYKQRLAPKDSEIAKESKA